MTSAEARFNNSLRPRKTEGSLGRKAQDVHLDSHTAPELWLSFFLLYFVSLFQRDKPTLLEAFFSSVVSTIPLASHDRMNI